MEMYHRLGFIGLGAMGAPMASNLAAKLAKDYKICIYDVSQEAMKSFAEAHGQSVSICHSPKEVSRGTDIIFTMLPEGSHVRAVYLDPVDGILHSKMSARLLLDCSTIDTETSLAVSTAVKSRFTDVAFYDAPVSGGTLGAVAASLTLMVGCSENDSNWSLVEGLLGLVGKNIIACGGPGMGLTAKLCNNYCSGLISLATAEAMNIGMRSGMDPRLLSRVFSKSTAQSTICDKFNPVPGICPDAPSSHGYRGGFKVQLMAKDFGLAVSTAETVGANLLLGTAGLEAYTQASQSAECRDLDSRVLFRHIGGQEDWEDDFKKSQTPVSR